MRRSTTKGNNFNPFKSISKNIYVQGRKKRGVNRQKRSKFYVDNPNQNLDRHVDAPKKIFLIFGAVSTTEYSDKFKFSD